jgi:molecular chaperone DnaK (HSP70)
MPADVRNSDFLQTAREKLNAIGKTPQDAVADYLRVLWEHAISSIKRDRGHRAVDGLPFKVVITIPAVWPPYAERKMREAAQRAGILQSRPCGPTTLDLVSEPEAAALATLREFQSRDRSSVRNDINASMLGDASP